MIASVRSRINFYPGQLVHHRLYDYRGVVVEVDPSCHADEDWYRANQTQPDRDQPWYHVLVDGTPTTTYVAQSNLEPDVSGRAVDHPLIDHFFSELTAKGYVRNDIEWPM